MTKFELFKSEENETVPLTGLLKEYGDLTQLAEGVLDLCPFDLGNIWS